jgi:branched-chain amino acid transport system substrate-binding protein
MGASLIGLAGLPSAPAIAQRRSPGVTDNEIKIGNINPYTGPASAYSLIARTQAAYFNKVNADGGVNGKRIRYLSYDDGYSPPRAVEQARRLVESDEALLIFQPLGTPSNSAIQRYMNQRQVPQLFVATGATKFGDPRNFPWTMGWQPNYQSEGKIYADYIVQNHPNGKIAVLFQNDDYGKDVQKGLKDGLGARAASMIVAEAPYEVTDPTVDSQVVRLKASGADIFVNIATPRGAAQAIRKVAELGWTATHILNNVSNSVGSVLRPAGLEASQGVISTFYLKDPTDPTWQNDEALRRWNAFMDQYFADGDKTSSFTIYGYATAKALVHVLQQCRDEVTRENVMRQAASMRDVEIDVLLPGIKMNTAANDFFPLEQLQMGRFNQGKWELFGPVMSGEVERT